MHRAASTIVMRREQPSYPNWQRKRIQNPCSVSSNLTEGTRKTSSTAIFPRLHSGQDTAGPQWDRSSVECIRNGVQVIAVKVSIPIQRQGRGLVSK